MNLRTAVRLLLALALAVFGADKFLHFVPKPDPPVEGGAFLGALTETGYIFPVIGCTFLVAALCLVLGRVALGLILVAPITVNILLYHYTYDRPGIVAGAVIAVLQLILALMHRGDFGSLFRSSAAGAGRD